MIEIKDLHFNYKSKFALEIEELHINPGIVGLLGTNGAGKTTFFKIISTLLPYQSGHIKIDDFELEARNYKDIRKILSYMPQDFDFFPSFKVHEVLAYFAVLKLIDSDQIPQRIEEVLAEVNMLMYKNAKASTLSGGLKRRLGFAISILNHPKILVLDEPTAGVDPKERIELRNSIKKYSKDRLVIISTHIVEDIENLCDDLIVMLDGHIKYSGKTNIFIENSPKVYEVTIEEAEMARYKDMGEIINVKYLDSNLIELTIVTRSPIEAVERKKNLESGYLYVQSQNSIY